ncbi:Gfo/Idh/MocA family protein [Arthrobacter sp. H14-L1]|uniref:Gfo/Idh/MocA family protein n=1 Tax=Arthrobacter sp. H14-L1 TaxID=2996697 RepID=UPI002271BBD2|nr:Gfo/Idh/MocA family oxidoreductase [Arthrobacter sp. H14-L1]MCY0906270.1 Gfo/Idh/MocA family oxidoreductase [Arthrobacter sp. H14-L1]
MGDDKAANIGIIGGGIRGSMFARAIFENPSARLIAICDQNSQTRDSAAERFNVLTYSSVEAMVGAHPELTAAVISTPDFAHREAAVICAQVGLDLMIEKPLATSEADAQAIISAAAKSGAQIMVGFENRWNPRFTAVKNLLESSDNGRVVNQQADLNDTIFVPSKMLSWAGRSSPAWFLMPHTLDLAIWLSGTSPVSVYARGSKGTLSQLGIDTWDSISATFTMDDGSYVVLNSSWILPETAPAVYDFRYEIQTTSGVFHVDGANQGVTHYGADGVSWPQFAVFEHNGNIGGVPIDMVNDFVEYVRGASVNVPTHQDGLLVTQAIEAVHESLSCGGVVYLTKNSQ